MSNTGTGRAWRFLKRNPDYAAEWEAAADAVEPMEAGPFPVRTQSAADRAAAAWGLMAWEDPLAEDGPASPFWTEAPALRGIPVCQSALKIDPIGGQFSTLLSNRCLSS